MRTQSLLNLLSLSRRCSLRCYSILNCSILRSIESWKRKRRTIPMNLRS
jgi:hypothetical protein